MYTCFPLSTLFSVITLSLRFWILTLIPPPFLTQGQLTASHCCPKFSGKTWMLVGFLLSISSKDYLGLVLCFPACPHYFWILPIWCFIQVRCLFFLLFVPEPLFPSSPAFFSLPDLWFLGLLSPGRACPPYSYHSMFVSWTCVPTFQDACYHTRPGFLYSVHYL